MEKGDVVTYGANSDMFKVEKDGDNWKVTLESAADNYDIWIGDFTITYQRVDTTLISRILFIIVESSTR